MWTIRIGQAAPAPLGVVLKPSHSSSAGSLGNWQGQGCVSVCLFNTDSQINSVPGLGGGSLSRSLAASQGSTLAARGRLGRETPELLLCCRGVSPGWLNREQS